MFKSLSILPLPQIFGYNILPSTLGRFIALICYSAVATSILISVDAPTFTPHFLDDVAFRAAWLTITQIPMVYLLSMKGGPVVRLSGLSHERLNSVHRWVGRFVFLSATIHVAFMKSSISIHDIVKSHDEGMSVVRYGIGAYSTLVWIVVTSILPLRKWNFRLFYLNHWITTIGFLVIIFQHVPSYARPPIYLAVGFLILDKGIFMYFFCRNNLSVRSIRRRRGRFRRVSDGKILVAGYRLEMSAPSSTILGLPTQTRNSTTILRISHLPLAWRPGQHVRLYVPALGSLELHPFTPANCSAIPPPPLPPRRDIERRGNARLLTSAQPAQTSDMLLFVREHAGFTRRLADYHAQWLTQPCPNASSEAPAILSAYIDGPYGSPPKWEEYESLILIATSSGVSFILAILDHIEQLCFMENGVLRTQRVKVIWLVRHVDPHLEETVKDLLLRYSNMLGESNIEVEAEFFITCPASSVEPELVQYDPFAHLREQRQSGLANRPPLRIRHPDEIYEEWDREAQLETLGLKEPDSLATELYGHDRYSFESEGSSNVSTLVDTRNEERHSEDPFSDAYATHVQDSAYRPLPPTRSNRPQRPEGNSTEVEGCKCALIQHQKRKLKIGLKHKDFIKRSSGTRPDLKYALQEAIQPNRSESTMVAVCANGKVVSDARSAVAGMNMEVAFGRRKVPVQIHSEEFG